VLHRTPDRLSIWGRSAKNGATVDDTLYDLTGIVNAFGPYQSRPCDVATIKPRRKNPLNVEMSQKLVAPQRFSLRHFCRIADEQQIFKKKTRRF
jgi:hypothetical protein